MKSILVLASLVICSCGSKALEDLTNKLAEPTATPEVFDNSELQKQIEGKWDLFSRTCEGEKFSFIFSLDMTGYIYKSYGSTYKFSYEWIGKSRMKFCLNKECRTDMNLIYDAEKSMLTINTDKCSTEYKRPEIMR